MKPNHPFLTSLPDPWDRFLTRGATVSVWAMLFGVIYLLRSFFLLIFLTFVFSYIQSRGVEKLQFKIKNRTIRVALIAVVFWTLLCAAGVFLVPKVKAQAELFISEFTVYLGRVDQELFSLRNKYPVLGEILPELEASGTVDKGVAICGSGIGISIACNRNPAVRAALCTDSTMARLTRLHNDANVVCMGERLTGTEVALDILKTFLETEFEGGRHQRRVDKLGCC